MSRILIGHLWRSFVQGFGNGDAALALDLVILAGFLVGDIGDADVEILDFPAKVASTN
ncbi:hypothetical protein ACEWPM_007515 [Roseovarius sp. S4756]|uniref:hypothetical protein n=1 Tax=Roseovarius maritimus TaxID=3342637 RepID=UPI00372A85AA